MADNEGIGFVERIGLMLAHLAKFSRHTTAGPQKLDTMTHTALGTNTFGRFLAQAD